MYRNKVLVCLFVTVLCLSVSRGLLAQGLSSEGGPITVGHLLDDKFFVYDPNSWDEDVTIKMSGWEVDVTGGTIGPIVDGDPYVESDLRVIDTSSTAGITLKHQLVSQTSGKITLEHRFMLPSKIDGYTWQLCCGNTPVVKILTYGGNVCYEDDSGSAVTLKSYNAGDEVEFKVVADISAGTATYSVDGTTYATNVPFRFDVHNINYFAFKTPDTATGSIYLRFVRITKGYVVYDTVPAEFSEVPDDWTTSTSGGSVSASYWWCGYYEDWFSYELDDTSSTYDVELFKTFSAQTGTLVWDFKFILPTKINGMRMLLQSNSTDAVKLVTDSGDICYENSYGAKVSIWDDYYANLWYTIRVVANEVTDTADIYVNGKIRATGVGFRNAVSGFDKIVFATPTTATGTMWVDDIMAYPQQPTAADYPPSPTVCASTNYYVGMQTYHAWREGLTHGWDWPYRFPTHDLYMGTFDEGIPEVSDWETRMNAEHGVDFTIEGWGDHRFGDIQGTPIKDPRHKEALHDAWFYSLHRSQIKFAIASWCNPTSDDWRNVVVPYLMEYYFKDPHYMLVDNKVVFAFGSPTGFISRLGGVAQAKAETDYLRQACVSAGFAGAILLVADGTQEPAAMNDLKNAGFDYAYTYGWNTSDLSYMETQMCNARDAAAQVGFNVIPTVSVGVSFEAADGPYYGYLTAAEFQTLNNWVKNTFMPTLPAGTLGRSMVMVDNWNEYGEGHWINPGTLAGFGYLDGLRAAWTSNPSHGDYAPMRQGKQRINALFPKGWIGHAWNFDSFYDDSEGWTSSGITGLAAANGYLNGTISTSDPQLVSRDYQYVDLDASKVVKIRMKNSSWGTYGRVLWSTIAEPSFTHSVTFPLMVYDSHYSEYTIDMSAASGWTGWLKQLRVDPVDDGTSAGSFSIDYIRVGDWADRTLKGAWRMDNNVGDSSGSDNNATLYNGTYVTGVKGSAVDLNGTDAMVVCPDSATLGGMAGLTVSVWVKLDSIPASGTYDYMVDKAGCYRICVDSSGVWHFVVGTTNNSLYTSGTSAVAPSALTTGTWYNLVGTYDGSVVRAYVNGAYVAGGSQYISGTIVDNANSLYFGAAVNQYLDGQIDSVRVYNRALSANEIINLYTTADDPAVYVKAEWSFDGDPSDTSGQDNHAIVNYGTYAAGFRNQALDCNGSTTYVSIADAPSLGGMPSVAVSAMVYLHGYPASGSQLLYKEGSWGIHINSNGTGFVQVGTTNNAWSSAGTTASWTTALSTNAWHQVVLSYDGQYLRVYIDGSLAGTGSQAISGNVVDSASYAYIGSGYGGYVDGLIDEVRLYDSGLSAAEIAALPY